MTPLMALTLVVQKFVNDALAEAQTAHREYLQTKPPNHEKEEKLHAANLARERLANFSAEFGGQFQCPSCWMHYEIHAPFKMIESKTKLVFQCDECELEFAIPK